MDTSTGAKFGEWMISIPVLGPIFSVSILLLVIFFLPRTILFFLFFTIIVMFVSLTTKGSISDKNIKIVTEEMMNFKFFLLWFLFSSLDYLSIRAMEPSINKVIEQSKKIFK